MNLTPEQVENLKTYQTDGVFHPYTCCDHQTMDATPQGLKCPKCGRVQTEIPEEVLDGSMMKTFWDNTTRMDWDELEVRKNSVLSPRQRISPEERQKLIDEPD
jgi:hypothetical protein